VGFIPCSNPQKKDEGELFLSETQRIVSLSSKKCTVSEAILYIASWSKAPFKKPAMGVSKLKSLRF
jgi:hypothetical protein